MECWNCGDTINDEDDEFLDTHGHHICQHCVDNHYVECSSCGELVHVSEVEYNHGEPYCESCFDDSDDSYYNDHPYDIRDYHEFPDNKIVFYGNTCNNTKPYLGIELEVDKGSYDNNSMGHQIGEIMPEEFVHFEHDGSLDEGFENITQPATLDFHMSIGKNYKKMFKALIHNKYRSHNTRTCGLHIHVNRSFLKDNEDLYITRILYIMEKFWDELTKFSRRRMENLEHWAKKYDVDAETVIRNSKNCNLDRYYALNLTNDNTIEFRMFKGTLKYSTFIATLQLVNSIVCKAKTVTESELQSLKWEDLLEYDEVKAYWEIAKDREVRR